MSIRSRRQRWVPPLGNHFSTPLGFNFQRRDHSNMVSVFPCVPHCLTRKHKRWASSLFQWAIITEARKERVPIVNSPFRQTESFWICSTVEVKKRIIYFLPTKRRTVRRSTQKGKNRSGNLVWEFSLLFWQCPRNANTMLFFPYDMPVLPQCSLFTSDTCFKVQLI